MASPAPPECVLMNNIAFYIIMYVQAKFIATETMCPCSVLVCCIIIQNINGILHYTLTLCGGDWSARTNTQGAQESEKPRILMRMAK